jgi:aspartyl-tRNA(Asn)/glutamyl-tRNA(Gln) amidotransferase subunit C
VIEARDWIVILIAKKEPRTVAEHASVTRDEVEKVAALAALALTAEELDRMGRDLSSILGYVAELDRLDTSGVEPLTHVSELFAPAALNQQPGILRPDEPGPSLARALIMENAPATDGTFFKVPKVIER